MDHKELIDFINKRITRPGAFLNYLSVEVSDMHFARINDRQVSTLSDYVDDSLAIDDFKLRYNQACTLLYRVNILTSIKHMHKPFSIDIYYKTTEPNVSDRTDYIDEELQFKELRIHKDSPVNLFIRMC